MKRILTSFVPAVTACLLALSSCGTSTKVVSSWNSPGGNARLNKVLVLGMMADRETKDFIEKTMVSDLAAQGIAAVTGTSEFGPKGFGSFSQEQVNKKLSDEGFDGIMIVCLTAKDKDLDYIPGSAYASPYGPTYYGYYGRYRYMWDTTLRPGYYTTTTTYVLDADLYSLPGDELIYSAQTKSFDPYDSKDLAESFSEEIIRDLRQKMVI